MASIYKRGHVWWVHYLVGGKSVSKSLKTTNERVALDRKKKLEAMAVTDQLPQPSNTPVESLLESFCRAICHDILHFRARVLASSRVAAQIQASAWCRRHLPC